MYDVTWWDLPTAAAAAAAPPLYFGVKAFGYIGMCLAGIWS